MPVGEVGPMQPRSSTCRLSPVRYGWFWKRNHSQPKVFVHLVVVTMDDDQPDEFELQATCASRKFPNDQIVKKKCRSDTYIEIVMLRKISRRRRGGIARNSVAMNTGRGIATGRRGSALVAGCVRWRRVTWSVGSRGAGGGEMTGFIGGWMWRHLFEQRILRSDGFRRWTIGNLSGEIIRMILIQCQSRKVIYSPEKERLSWKDWRRSRSFFTWNVRLSFTAVLSSIRICRCGCCRRRTWTSFRISRW